MRIVTYGMGKDRVLELVRSCGASTISVDSVSDFQAANDIKSGKANFAIGVCQSGAGGALAMPMALLGPKFCAQLSTPSRQPSREEILEAVKQGKQVFGLALSHLDFAIPILMDEFATSSES